MNGNFICKFSGTFILDKRLEILCRLLPHLLMAKHDKRGLIMKEYVCSPITQVRQKPTESVGLCAVTSHRGVSEESRVAIALETTNDAQIKTPICRKKQIITGH